MKRPDILRRKEDFDDLFRKGRSAGSRYVVVICLRNGLDNNRKAFLASKKVGNSVLRNRARRLMKEAFRKTEADLPTGYDILLIARNTITEAKCEDVRKSLDVAFKRAGLKDQR